MNEHGKHFCPRLTPGAIAKQRIRILIGSSDREKPFRLELVYSGEKFHYFYFLHVESAHFWAFTSLFSKIKLDLRFRRYGCYK